MTAAIISLIAAAIPLIILIIKEFLGAKARAREEEKEYRLTRETFKKAISDSVNRIKDMVIQEKKVVDSIDESADQILKNKKKKEN